MSPPSSSRGDVLREVVALKRQVATLQRHARVRSRKVRWGLERAEGELEDWLTESRSDPKAFAEYDMRSTWTALQAVRAALREIPEDAE